MGVWKKLNSQDAFVTSYVAKKQWSPSSNEVEGLGIKFLPANSTFRETDCKFKIVNCAFSLAGSVRDCSFVLQAITETVNIFTPTPTATATFTPTPTATVDCSLELNATP